MKRKKKQGTIKRKTRQSKIATQKEINLAEPEDGIFTAREEVAVLLKRVGLPQKDIGGIMKKIDKVDREKSLVASTWMSAEEIKKLQEFGREIGLTSKETDRRIKKMNKIDWDKTPPTTTGPMDAEELQKLDEEWIKQDEIDKANKVGIWSKDFDRKKRKLIEKV